MLGILKTFRPAGYSVCDNGVLTDRVVYWYDPEEYEEHKQVNPSRGKPDRTISPRWFRCDVCGGKFPRADYNNSWDWSGPHCPNPECGNGGLDLFAKTHPPVRCGRAEGDQIGPGRTEGDQIGSVSESDFVSKAEAIIQEWGRV